MPITLDGSTGITAGAFTAGAYNGIDQADLATALNASGSAPIYACRAWVHFNGSGTVAILGSGNVTSITDNGAGDYTANFTTAMLNANYGFAATSRNTFVLLPSGVAPTASALRFLTSNTASNVDSSNIGVIIVA